MVNNMNTIKITTNRMGKYQEIEISDLSETKETAFIGKINRNEEEGLFLIFYDFVANATRPQDTYDIESDMTVYIKEFVDIQFIIIEKEQKNML